MKPFAVWLGLQDALLSRSWRTKSKPRRDCVCGLFLHLHDKGKVHTGARPRHSAVPTHKLDGRHGLLQSPSRRREGSLARDLRLVSAVRRKCENSFCPRQTVTSLEDGKQADPTCHALACPTALADSGRASSPEPAWCHALHPWCYSVLAPPNPR